MYDWGPGGRELCKNMGKEHLRWKWLPVHRPWGRNRSVCSRNSEKDSEAGCGEGVGRVTGWSWRGGSHIGETLECRGLWHTSGFAKYLEEFGVAKGRWSLLSGEDGETDSMSWFPHQCSTAHLTTAYKMRSIPKADPWAFLPHLYEPTVCQALC